MSTKNSWVFVTSLASLATAAGATGCAMLGGLGGGGGTVRVHNATTATPLCKVVIGHRKTLKSYEQQIEPGGFADFAASDPGANGQPQQPVKLQPCKGSTFMVENISFAQGKKHMVVVYDGTDPPALETPPGFARYDKRNSRDDSQLGNLPRWQDEKGMKSDWVFFSLRSKCDHMLDYKYTPGTRASQLIEPPPADGYKFWRGSASAYVEVDTHSTDPIVVWLRDNQKKQGGGDWVEAYKIEPGKSVRLEVDKSCKKIVERTDDERFHGCYEWAYAPACDIDRRTRVSKQPPGCPEGTPSVEGDLSKVCEVKTDKGLCTVRYAQKAAGCDVR